MANQLSGSTFYVDSAHNTDADDVIKKQTLVSWILVTATGSNARIVLADVGDNGATKFDLRLMNGNTSQLFHLRGQNAVFSNGIKVVSISNCVATIGITNSGS